MRPSCSLPWSMAHVLSPPSSSPHAPPPVSSAALTPPKGATQKTRGLARISAAACTTTGSALRGAEHSHRPCPLDALRSWFGLDSFHAPKDKHVPGSFTDGSDAGTMLNTVFVDKRVFNVLAWCGAVSPDPNPEPQALNPSPKPWAPTPKPKP